ncbi:MAG TPA: LysM peptidoglycan-binding domain-containing protein [Aggregatilineales bacterium]|nr:LysM peptidoglycan-binding domain-containing protein [Aggregatilineales bacterium]
MNALKRFIVAVALVGAIVLATTPAQAAGTYVVQTGDTLFSIAAKFGVSVSELATINKIYDVNALYVGQTLILPNPLPAGYVPAYPTNPNPVNQPIAPASPYQPGVPIYTPPIVTYPVGTTVTTVTSYRSYVVQPGDFLSSIAARFGTTPQAILAANFITDPNLLYVGQLLTVPVTSTRVVPARPQVRPASGRYYIVQPGDNLFGIAARFGRDVYAVARANGILNLNAIYVGQPLIIP